MDLLIEGVQDKGIFKAVFMAGGPGSGKSYVVRNLFGIPDTINISVSGLKSVNSDTAFEKLLIDNGFDPVVILILWHIPDYVSFPICFPPIGFRLPIERVRH